MQTQITGTSLGSHYKKTVIDVTETFKVFEPKKVIKFELPYMEHFDLDPDEDNLFDLKIPYCKIVSYSLRSGIKSTNAKYSKESSNKAGRLIIETVAQMVQYQVDPEVYNLDLNGEVPKKYEDYTPYRILKEYADSANLKIIVDEEKRILSLEPK